MFPVKGKTFGVPNNNGSVTEFSVMLQEHSYLISLDKYQTNFTLMVLIIYVIWPKFIEREQSFVTENVHVAAKRTEDSGWAFSFLFCF